MALAWIEQEKLKQIRKSISNQQIKENRQTVCMQFAYDFSQGVVVGSRLSLKDINAKWLDLMARFGPEAIAIPQPWSPSFVIEYEAPEDDDQVRDRLAAGILSHWLYSEDYYKERKVLISKYKAAEKKCKADKLALQIALYKQKIKVVEERMKGMGHDS